MFLRMWFLFVLFIFSFLTISECVEKPSNTSMKNSASGGFGPYFLTTRSVEACVPSKKPKDDKYTCVMDVYVHKVSRIKEEFKGTILIKENLLLTKGSINVQLWKDGGFKPFYNQVFRDPCHTVLLSTLMEKFVNPDKNCLVKKANYSIQNVAANEIVHLLTGDNFFYERVAITLEWFTEYGSACCLKVMCESKPIKKNKRGN